jgi:hypothetical protein
MVGTSGRVPERLAEETARARCDQFVHAAMCCDLKLPLLDFVAV